MAAGDISKKLVASVRDHFKDWSYNKIETDSELYTKLSEKELLFCTSFNILKKKFTFPMVTDRIYYAVDDNLKSIHEWQWSDNNKTRPFGLTKFHTLAVQNKRAIQISLADVVNNISMIYYAWCLPGTEISEITDPELDSKYHQYLIEAVKHDYPAFVKEFPPNMSMADILQSVSILSARDNIGQQRASQSLVFQIREHFNDWSYSKIETDQKLYDELFEAELLFTSVYNCLKKEFTITLEAGKSYYDISDTIKQIPDYAWSDESKTRRFEVTNFREESVEAPVTKRRIYVSIDQVSAGIKLKFFAWCLASVKISETSGPELDSKYHPYLKYYVINKHPDKDIKSPMSEPDILTMVEKLSFTEIPGRYRTLNEMGLINL